MTDCHVVHLGILNLRFFGGKCPIYLGFNYHICNIFYYIICTSYKQLVIDKALGSTLFNTRKRKKKQRPQANEFQADVKANKYCYLKTSPMQCKIIITFIFVR